MPAPIDDGYRVPDWIRSLVSDAPRSIPSIPRSAPRDEQEAARRRAERELRRIIYAAIRRFAETLTWEMRVPGRYPGGPTFEDVLGFLAERGKDFAADSKTMQSRVRTALMAEYEDADAIPLAFEFRETAAEAILETIVARIENRLRDVSIAANRQSYTRAKMRAGYDSRVGIRTGALLAALKSPSTTVKVKGTTR